VLRRRFRSSFLGGSYSRAAVALLSDIGRRRRPAELLVRCSYVTDGETGERLFVVHNEGEGATSGGSAETGGLEQHSE
jgi:hypothetical protein